MNRISPTLSHEMSVTHESLSLAVASGHLLDSAKTNILALLAGTISQIAL